jgi:hypothetical protein
MVRLTSDAAIEQEPPRGGSLLIPAQSPEQASRRSRRDRKAQRAAQAFATSLTAWLMFEPLCNAEVLKAGRIVLEVPDGGFTLVEPPGSISEFKHPKADVTLTAEVGGAKNYEYWKLACSPSNNDPAHQIGALARADQYVYYKVSKDSKYGISTPRGFWLEHCLVWRAGELSAKVTIDLPKSTLEQPSFEQAKIEKVLGSVRLTPASVNEGGASDPRIVFEELDDGFVPASRPIFTYRFQHNRSPLSIEIALSEDPMNYETAKRRFGISAMPWKIGHLDRSDDYFYYFVWPYSYPAFELGFRALGVMAQVGVSVSKDSLEKGEISIPEIERILASARITSSSKPAE